MANPFRKSHAASDTPLPSSPHEKKGTDSPVEVLSAIEEPPWSPGPNPLNVISGIASQRSSAEPVAGSNKDLGSLDLDTPTLYMLQSNNDSEDAQGDQESQKTIQEGKAVSANQQLPSSSQSTPEESQETAHIRSKTVEFVTPGDSPMEVDTTEESPQEKATLKESMNSTPRMKSASPNIVSLIPKLALSSDELDRHILSTDEQLEHPLPYPAGSLIRSNAILGRKAPQAEVLDFQKLLSRAKSMKIFSNRKKDSKSPPLMFAQNSITRSLSANHTGRALSSSVGIAARDPIVRKGAIQALQAKSVSPIESATNDSIQDSDKATFKQPEEITNNAETLQGGRSEVLDEGIFEIDDVPSLSAGSPYYILTEDSELNFSKQKQQLAQQQLEHQQSHGELPLAEENEPELESVITKDWISDDKLRDHQIHPFVNFYKAEDNALNLNGPQENLLSFIANTKPSDSDSQGYTSKMKQSIHDSDVEVGDSDSGEIKRKKHELWKTMTIWLLILLVIVLLCVFIPLVVSFSRGNDLTTKSYLSNISPLHRDLLLAQFMHYQNVSIDDIGSNSTMNADITRDLKNETIAILKDLKEDQAGRIRGGLRSPKFKTKTRAGISKFSQIPITFQKSHELKGIMENPLLHNVFYGIDYAPKNVIYPNCGATSKEVMLDVALLSQVTSRIRTYGTQCNQSKLILDSIHYLNLNVTLSPGVWIGSDQDKNRRQITELKEILREYPREYFESIFVGNEVIFRNDQSSDVLIKYIQEVKSFVQIELNWDLPVGTSDVGHRTDPAVLNACDFYGSNTHPFFQGEDVETATRWVFDYMQYQIEPFKHLVLAESKLPKIMISEVGWPSEGGSYKEATAGTGLLQSFLDTWVCEANNQSYPWYFFEAFDEPWKEIYHRTDAEWETHWGLFTADRKLKDGIVLPDCADYKLF